MPAEKAARVSIHKRSNNRSNRRNVKNLVRKSNELLVQGDLEQGADLVAQAIRTLDRTARKGTIHPNNAARRKSRLMKKLNRSQGTTSPSEKATDSS